MNKETIVTLSQNSFGGRMLEYVLCESESFENDKSYGVELNLRSDDKNECVRIDDISGDRTEVINLIDYLAENGVSIIHFRDVIEDYIESIY